MELETAIGEALRQLREAAHLTQEDFVGVSGRTYLSELERGLKSPTVEKIDQLASRLGVHPLALLTLCFMKRDGVELVKLQQIIAGQLRSSLPQ